MTVQNKKKKMHYRGLYSMRRFNAYNKYSMKKKHIQPHNCKILIAYMKQYKY